MDKNKKHTSIFAAISLCLIAAALIFIPLENKTPSTKSIPERPVTTQVPTFETSQALLDYFSSIGYAWPITKNTVIPTSLIKTMPQDAKNIRDTKTRKTLFIRTMIPIILAEQKQIREKRKTLIFIFNNLQQQSEKNATSPLLKEKLASLFQTYKIKKNLNFTEKFTQLLNRYDELPLTLVLAQAAIESGWGTSRFTRVGNSLFGEWTYKKEEGIIPQGREEGKTHRIKAFKSLQGSIASYIKNINRNNAYKELRQLRLTMRNKNQPLDARKLATGLQRYSQKGQAYVISLLQILNSKEFKIIESLQLDNQS